VGGTAGKGSTASMCAAILNAAGYKVGLHTKPHLRSETERARINGVAIPEERFAQVFGEMLAAIEQMELTPHGRPSYFELLVALAFKYFEAERVDVGVIEVGLGGTLDGTNVIEPLVTILTNVGLDHIDVLGDTVEAIAIDKAGIIKSGIPVITAAEHPDALRVIRATAAERGAPLTLVREAAEIEPHTAPPYSEALAVRTARRTYDLTLPLMGEFQHTNAATALLACEAIEERFAFSAAAAESGLAGLALQGRMEFYPSSPSLLFDVAHNTEKAAALRDGLLRHFKDRRMTFVVAIAESKDAAHMLDAWSALPAQFIFTTFDVSHRRPTAPRILASMAADRGKMARAVEDPIEALSLARRVAAADDLVVVTGSTFLVADLRGWFLENSGAHDRAAV
jgi:dihydrofolate synthase/folylpolyglutamate synthase